MVNVSMKSDTRRVAVASGRVHLGAHVFSLVTANSISKGDVPTVAKIAGIMGAKQTGDLIPLCHNLLLSGVDLSLSLNEGVHAVDIEA
jgi:cyclic pyranopterin phosphate synthase